MKNKTMVIMSAVLVAGVIVGYALAFTKGNRSTTTMNNKGNGWEENINRNNCVADECLVVDSLDYPAGVLSKGAKDALGEAINDEYKAYTLYEKTLAKFGFVRPFSMIIRAEEQHISSLKALFDKYGLEVPSNNWSGKVAVETTLQKSCQAGVDAEIANAKLYREKLIPAVSGYEDIKSVFNNLMNASQEKHLTAFEGCN